MAERFGLLLAVTEGTIVRYADISPLPGFSSESHRETEQDLAHLLDRCRTSSDLKLAAPHRFPSMSWGLAQITADLPTSDLSLPVNGLLTGDHDTVLGDVQRQRADGYRSFKLKVGKFPIAQEIATVRAIRAAVGSSVELRLDANRAWSLDDAVTFGRGIADCGIRYIEEPVRDPAGLEDFHRVTGLPLALDESLRDGQTISQLAERIRSLAGLAAIIIRPMLLGSTEVIRQLAAVADARGVSVVCSSAFESSVGVAAVARLAAKIANRSTACGFDTLSWLTDDSVSPPLTIQHGHLSIPANWAEHLTLNRRIVEQIR